MLFSLYKYLKIPQARLKGLCLTRTGKRLSLHMVFLALGSVLNSSAIWKLSTKLKPGF